MIPFMAKTETISFTEAMTTTSFTAGSEAMRSMDRMVPTGSKAEPTAPIRLTAARVSTRLWGEVETTRWMVATERTRPYFTASAKTIRSLKWTGLLR